MKKRFHQFVLFEKGPVNTAIIDFLKGNTYQVNNSIVEKFESEIFNDIDDFMSACEAEEMLIEVNEKFWIPRIFFEKKEMIKEFSFCLETEEGVDFDLITEKMRGFDLSQIVFYGQTLPQWFFPDVEKKTKPKDFEKCRMLSTIDRKLGKVDNSIYDFNLNYNSCWGRKIAVTAEGILKPCIYSDMVIGDLKEQKLDDSIEKIKSLWGITKDKVETCKDCELRYVCFDCREIARKTTGNLFGANPNCGYNPYKGIWTK